MTSYLSKSALLAALTSTHERTIEASVLGGAILIREFTARQREAANAAAVAENPDDPDNTLYRAMLMQQCIVDPESGTPDATGNIDPRTRTPLLTTEDVLNLASSRSGAFGFIWDQLVELAAMGPQSLTFRHPAHDTGERDAGAGAGEPGDPAGGDAEAGPGDDGERAPAAGDDGEGGGPGAEPIA